MLRHRRPPPHIAGLGRQRQQQQRWRRPRRRVSGAGGLAGLSTLTNRCSATNESALYTACPAHAACVGLDQLRGHWIASNNYIVASTGAQRKGGPGQQRGRALGWWIGAPAPAQGARCPPTRPASPSAARSAQQQRASTQHRTATGCGASWVGRNSCRQPRLPLMKGCPASCIHKDHGQQPPSSASQQPLAGPASRRPVRLATRAR